MSGKPALPSVTRLRLADRRSRVHGVDFSGAAEAGRKIWIASGIIQGDSLRIDDCRRAETLPGSGRDRELALNALRDFIAYERDAVFGLDFPFGLPCGVMAYDSWDRFVHAFPTVYPTPEMLRKACRRAARGRELKRVADVECHTPFSPYNLRLYRQTYFGIRDVLSPLVRSRSVSVLPMQRAQKGRAWLLEICPASTLKKSNRYAPYKGRTADRRATRERMLAWMHATCSVSVHDSTLRSTISDDSDGDALDSVIAALAVFRALRDPARLAADGNEAYRIEGYVYA
jgi:hypothetical protein